ncbi:MAG: carbon-nitrogen hydrolase [Deltaproteobacteria bacterium]|nr:carbon-nitrogen hydrolase [Deltaproteobacteria bacterium]
MTQSLVEKGSHLNVAMVQQSCNANRNKNIAATCAAIDQAVDGGAQLVVLQELHTSLYFCQTQRCDNFDLAETIPGPSSDYFSKIAQQHNIVIVTSLFERRASGVYHNTAVVFERDGTIAGTYRKMHIPDDPGYHEKFYFTPGDSGFKPITTSVGKLGILVCWDQWYPEAARLMTLAGADILIYPTAIGWDPHDDSDEQKRQLDAWITVQRGHAVANGIPVIAVNRVGFEADPSGHTQGANFWGNSFAVGPQGEFIAQANEKDEIVVHAHIDLQRSEQVRRIWPFLRDRRIDCYQEICERVRD